VNDQFAAHEAMGLGIACALKPARPEIDQLTWEGLSNALNDPFDDFSPATGVIVDSMMHVQSVRCAVLTAWPLVWRFQGDDSSPR
jgi:hypothetical protein